MRDIDLLGLVLQTPGALAPIIWGSPGGAKTAKNVQLARFLREPLEIVISSIRDPSDFAGLPVPDNGHGVRMEPPGWAVRLKEQGHGILFLDECSCFVAGTKVQTVNGPVPIEKVTVGTLVPAFDFEKNAVVDCPVTRRIVKYSSSVVQVTLSDGRALRATADHEFYTPRGWVEAGHLRRGDRVRLLSAVQKDHAYPDQHAPQNARADGSTVHAAVPGLSAGVGDFRQDANGQGVGDQEVHAGVAGTNAAARNPIGQIARRAIGERKCGHSGAFNGHNEGNVLQGRDGGQFSQGGIGRARQAPGIATQAVAGQRAVLAIPGGASAKSAANEGVVGQLGKQGPGRPGKLLRDHRGQDSFGDRQESSGPTGTAVHGNLGGALDPTGLHGRRPGAADDSRRQTALAQPGLRSARPESGRASGQHVRDAGTNGRGETGLLACGVGTASGVLQGHEGQHGGCESASLSGWLEVTATETVEHRGNVYDLTVQSCHNYFAEGVLVHNCAPPAVQAALLRVVLERTVGDLTLPDSVRVVAAANPPDQAAGGWDLAPPLANRFVHLRWSAPGAEEWSNWLLSEGDGAASGCVRLDLEAWQAQWPMAKALVTAFLRRRPGLLNEDLTKVQSRFPLAYATPRTWECAVRLLATCRTLPSGQGDEAVVELLSGTVGDAVTMEFASWLRENDLPDPEALLKDPDSWKPDAKHPDRVFATCVAVAEVVLADKDKKYTKKQYAQRWHAAWKVLARAMPLGKDVVVIAGRRIAGEGHRPDGGLSDPLVKKLIMELVPVIQASGIAGG